MITLFLCGDVMTGRGVDQILMAPSAPEIHERCVRDAREYVALAERASGPIPRRVDPAYMWGDALAELERVAPDARIVNLETSITRSSEHPAPKGINYRMHPANVGCLTAARIDVCAPIEIYKDRLVLYGCGDFIDDYEGIRGYEAFKDDLVLMYFATVDPATGRLMALRMAPMRIRKMRLNRASPDEAAWLRTRLTDISRRFGASVELAADGSLFLRPPCATSYSGRGGTLTQGSGQADTVG